MVKTITIKDKVYKKLVSHKGKEESFSDLFERLMEKNAANSIDILDGIRGTIDFDKSIKKKIISDILSKRSEKRD